jgi:ABC-type dipeptide/oligopeptide/nickel transport system permease component
MSTVFILERWLGGQLVPLVFIGFAVLMGFALLYFSAQSRRAALVRDRSGKTEETFAEYLAAYGFDPEIARATYRYLQQVQHVEFPIVPVDDLDRDLGLDDNDVKQTVRDLLGETGREYLPGLLQSPLVTVVDLVRYIQSSPRRVKAARRIA